MPLAELTDAVDVAYGPQIQPAQQALAVVILMGFAATQWRIQRSNAVAGQVVETEKSLNQAKIKQLGEGKEEYRLEVVRLEQQLQSQKEESLRLKTLVQLVCPVLFVCLLIVWSLL